MLIDNIIYVVHNTYIFIYINVHIYEYISFTHTSSLIINPLLPETFFTSHFEM